MIFLKETPLKKTGFTLIELVVTIAVILVLMSAVIVFVNPSEFKSKAIDEKRLTEIATLDRMINEHKIDTGYYPDQAGVLRTSTSLPLGNAGPYENISRGWLNGTLSDYSSSLPIDPVNDGTYYFSYQHNGTGYEINAVLEYFTEYMADDGGNNPAVYEVGNNLTIL